MTILGNNKLGVPVLMAIASISFLQLSGCNSTKESVTTTTSPTTTTQVSPTASPSGEANTNTGNWYGYKSSDGSYAAEFPAKPEEQKRDVAAAGKQVDFTLVNYQDSANKRFYATAVSNIPLPAGAKFNVEQGLNGARDNAAKSANAKISKETKITLNGLPGREVILEGQNNIVAKQRMYVDPQKLRLYQAILVVEDGNIDFPEGQKFFDSFQINK